MDTQIFLSITTVNNWSSASQLSSWILFADFDGYDRERAPMASCINEIFPDTVAALFVTLPAHFPDESGL